MPDTFAGARVKPADFPPARSVFDNTANNNITSTTYVAGSPEVGVTFVAPTSGRVLLTVGFAAKDSASNRVHLAPQIFLGTSNAGTQFLAPDVVGRGVGSVGNTSNVNQHRSRTSLITGLTAGSTYYVRTMHKVSGGSTADLEVRDIVVEPVS
ncbi:hypothetical protein [Herbidospora daliensis]|uniref:hypothetical protein n=1 Tax=Herbidospora daliensis TaxID=295585 RepID=UPI000B1D1324|nr:hypothetical protein [Herbidospora daliensis]